jgi:hypothetical protein
VEVPPAMAYPTSTSVHRVALLALVASAALVVSTARDARADGCKPNGNQCATSVSCCSRNCAKPIVRKAKALFGLCCPTGEGIVGGQCSCVPNCTNKTCGDDGCGGSCGTCDASACSTCGASNTCVSACTTGQVCFQSTCCTTATCGASCGMISDGCGGTLDCGACPTTTTTTATSSTTTTTEPTCANGGIACGSPCGGACGGTCATAGSGCETTHCDTGPVCIVEATESGQCAEDADCPTGQACGSIGLGGACNAVGAVHCFVVCPEGTSTTTTTTTAPTTTTSTTLCIPLTCSTRCAGSIPDGCGGQAACPCTCTIACVGAGGGTADDAGDQSPECASCHATCTQFCLNLDVTICDDENTTCQ